MERTEAKAVAKTVRISPRKTRLIIDLIRGKNVNEARAILANQPQRASRVISKVLESAIANATNNFGMKEENLYVKECYVDEALVIKKRGEDGHKLITVRLREDTLSKLDKIAAETNYSRNELINVILSHGVENIIIE